MVLLERTLNWCSLDYQGVGFILWVKFSGVFIQFSLQSSKAPTRKSSEKLPLSMEFPWSLGVWQSKEAQPQPGCSHHRKWQGWRVSRRLDVVFKCILLVEHFMNGEIGGEWIGGTSTYGCWTKNRGILPPKMDGENHGNPMKIDDLGGFSLYFWFNTHILWSLSSTSVDGWRLMSNPKSAQSWGFKRTWSLEPEALPVISMFFFFDFYFFDFCV